MERTIKEIFPNVAEPIEKSFELNGVQYYQFSGIELPVLRYYALLTFNDEFDQRCTKEEIQLTCKGILECLDKGKLTDAAILTHNLEERTKLANNFETVYRLAAATCFDATEDPNRFDFDYTLKKAKMFEKAPIDVFFLSKLPIVKSIRLGTLSTADLHRFYLVAKKIGHLHMENLLERLSDDAKMTELFKSVMSQKTQDSL